MENPGVGLYRSLTEKTHTDVNTYGTGNKTENIHAWVTSWSFVWETTLSHLQSAKGQMPSGKKNEIYGFTGFSWNQSHPCFLPSAVQINCSGLFLVYYLCRETKALKLGDMHCYTVHIMHWIKFWYTVICFPLIMFYSEHILLWHGRDTLKTNIQDQETSIYEVSYQTHCVILYQIRWVKTKKTSWGLWESKMLYLILIFIPVPPHLSDQAISRLISNSLIPAYMLERDQVWLHSLDSLQWMGCKYAHILPDWTAHRQVHFLLLQSHGYTQLVMIYYVCYT